MVTQEMIDRINTLYHKSQATGLTEEEKAEQAELRKKYVEAIRTSMRSNLNKDVYKRQPVSDVPSKDEAADTQGTGNVSRKLWYDHQYLVSDRCADVYKRQMLVPS